MNNDQQLIRNVVRRVSVDNLVAPRAGTPFAGDPEITLLGTAWAKIRQHAASELRLEVGGLLLGEVFNNAEGRTHVVVREAIAATETVASAVSVEFTFATWKRFLEDKAAHYSGETIVGWYHTHPGFGLFLSSLDQFLHRHFFPRPWHLALVVDPVARSAAFFLTTPTNVVRRDNFSIRFQGETLWGETFTKHLAHELTLLTERARTRLSPTGRLALQTAQRRLKRLASSASATESPASSQTLQALSILAEVWPALQKDWRGKKLQALTSKTLSIAQLNLILPLKTRPMAVAGSPKWLCAATLPGALHLLDIGQTQSQTIYMTDNREVNALALDDHDHLYILCRARREIWRVALSAEATPRRLSVEGYDAWDVALLSGLAVVDDQILIWDWNTLLYLAPAQRQDTLRVTARLVDLDLRVAQTLRSGNHHLAVAGSHIWVNNPEMDRVESLRLGERLESSPIMGAAAGLHQALAIAATRQHLWVLDSEGARILQLKLDGKPQAQYLLDEAIVEKGFLALAAGDEVLYLAAPDGLYSVDLSSL